MKFAVLLPGWKGETNVRRMIESEEYMPTKAEIEQVTALIRAEWSDAEHEVRRRWFVGDPASRCKHPKWTPPTVSVTFASGIDAK